MSAQFLLALLSITTTTAAQLIPVKTIAIADGDQFSFFPSSNFGMAGVTIAQRDSAHDLFANPALGSRVGRAYIFSSPTAVSVSRRKGGGSSLPVGMVARLGPAFAATAVAVQSISDGKRDFSFPTTRFESAGVAGNTNDSHTNRYGFLMLGRTFPSSKLSVGASVLWSGLKAIDGVSLLYADSRQVSQSGGMHDVRLGVLKEWQGGQSLEALLLQHGVGMSNDVLYADQYWDPVRHQQIEQSRMEHDAERTNTWGLQFKYQRPIADSGLRVGAVFTANRIDQPNAASYEIASVPGDRTRASALNLGIGIAKSGGATTVAIDLIHEPIWSRMWALAESAVESPSAGTIQAGSATMDSRVRFSNKVLRMGWSRDVELSDAGSVLQLQVGLHARSVYFTLDQHDLVSGSTRTASESWLEWTRSLGMTLRFRTFELHYRARVSSGGGRPGFVDTPGGVSFGEPDVQSIPPGPGPTVSGNALSGVSVSTHQLSISLIRRN